MINERRKEIIDKLLGKKVKVGNHIYTISDGLSIVNLRIVVDEIELSPTLTMIRKMDGSTIGKTDLTMIWEKDGLTIKTKSSDEILEQMWATYNEEEK